MCREARQGVGFQDGVSMVDLSRRELLAGGGAAVGTTLGVLYRTSGHASKADLLRPPGASAPSQFLASCIRCGQCVEACPFDTLRLAGLDRGTSIGTPYVTSREVPCYFCQGYDELRCIAVCPTGALQPVSDWAQIRMGTAVIDERHCLAWSGTMCRACWHACPFPNRAISMDSRGRPTVNEDTCIGCGLCNHACLTEPSSITIRPALQSGFALAENPRGNVEGTE